MRRWLATIIGAALLLATALAGPAAADDPLDPAHQIALPCELVSTPGLAPRSAKDIAHLANVCGFVGTDVEFQSRSDALGKVHDYAFVGTMGAGTRIYDITDPRLPRFVGGYFDPGWQNDVQVRGDLLVVGFDPLVVGVNVSVCLRTKSPNAVNNVVRGGVDIVQLVYDPSLAAAKAPLTFQTQLLGCYLTTNGGGAHNSTIHPSGDWLTINTSSTRGIEVVDLRDNAFTFVRQIPSSVAARAHDVFFSQDGTRLYSAGISSTPIVDVTGVFARPPTQIANIPNSAGPGENPDGHVIQISHQADIDPEAKLIVISDEKGGGLSNTRCNQSPTGAIGGLHFWALREIAGIDKSSGATETTPKKLGTWIYPNPLLALDPFDPVLQQIGRTERACTVHVFRIGGNGSSSPGAIAPGFDGVSRLPSHQLVTGHYGAGVWWIDFSRTPTAAGGIADDPRTTWGNTRGWNVMPGADTWSAKEYKGFIYTGDIARGFDVYSFTTCEDLGCVILPTSTPGRANGGGRTTGDLAELSILSGTSSGGKATFGFNVEYVAGQIRPTGDLTFIDHVLGKKVKATSLDFFDVAGGTATFGGLADVDGRPGVRFVVHVEDLGEPGTGDSFRLVLSDAYLAGGVLVNGNIQVSGGALSLSGETLWIRLDAVLA